MNTISKQELDPSLTTVAVLFDKGNWEQMSRDVSVAHVHGLVNACFRKARNEGKTFNGLDLSLIHI